MHSLLTLPDDVLIAHILPYSTLSTLLHLLHVKPLHSLIRTSMATHQLFHVHSDAAWTVLPQTVAQIGALRRILRLSPENHTTIVLLPPVADTALLYSGYIPPVVIDYSGLLVLGQLQKKVKPPTLFTNTAAASKTSKTSKTTAPPPRVALYHNIHVTSGANHVAFQNLEVINTHNKQLRRDDDVVATTTFQQAGILVTDPHTSVTLTHCMVTNQPQATFEVPSTSSIEAHGLVVTNGATAHTTQCLFRDNGKSGVFVRDVGSVVTTMDCECRHNQDYGMYVERGGAITMLGQSYIHHNQWYGLGCYGKQSVITIGSRHFKIEKNTNDSYGSKYGYVKGGGVIQLLCGGESGGGGGGRYPGN